MNEEEFKSKYKGEEIESFLDTMNGIAPLEFNNDFNNDFSI